MNNAFIKQLRIEWNRIDSRSYLKKIPSLQKFNSMEFTGPVTFFTGENGSGKSTLLEAIAVAYGFNPEGGSLNYHFSTYDSHSELYTATKLSKGYKMPKWGVFYRAESYYNVATKEKDYTDLAHPSRGLHSLSHGESFMELMETQFSPNSLYIFDEPEAALSPRKQMSLMAKIYEYSKQGCQFIIATHSPIILAVPGRNIWSFDDGQIRPCRYENTSCYQITHMFMTRRQQLMEILLSEQETEKYEENY